MRQQSIAGGLAMGLLCMATPAFAATISGKISDSGAAGLSGMEVRLWADSGKGYQIDQLVLSAADGTYSFSGVSAGTYKLDARMAPMVSGNLGDRWYDVAAPNANGYVGADADEIPVADSDVLTGMNIVLEALGGLDTRVMAGATPVQGIRVRAELKTDERIHHVDVTQGPCCGTNPHLGRAYFRGMVLGNYRFIAYDPAGIYRTTVLNGPYTVTANNDANAGDVAISTMIADPSEPNNTSMAAGTPTIAALPYTPSNSSVAPAGDIDFYCLNALAGERYEANVTSLLSIDGVERRHPWFDPMIGLWDGSSIVMSNDDATPGQSWDAALDTGPLPTDGRYCFVITTFGDAGFSGAGQLSAGEYQLEVDYGNRAPSLTVTYEGNPAPVPPTEISVDEDTPMQFDLAFSDPDGDLLNVEVRHVDNSGATVTAGNLMRLADTATYTWTPNQQDAAKSPFELTFRVTDAEFDLRIPVVVRVGAVSVPPTIPVPVEPADGATVDMFDVNLVVENSTDADGDPLTYDFQVEVGEPDAAPEAEATETEDPSGMTSTLVMGLPENGMISWRARAFDGADYSAWSDWSTFLVDTGNDAPEPPEIIKPTANEELTERQPTIASTVPVDPEGDAVTVAIELARDADFADIVGSSGPLAPSTDMTMVSWLSDDLLDWGGEYFARASATDDQGATSEFSAVVPFRIRFENELVAPSFSGTFALCEAATLDAIPTDLPILNIDQSGDAVRFEVEVIDSEDMTIASGAADQSEDIETTVALEVIAEEIPAGEYVVRVRAIRGDETTEWTACPLTLSGSGGGPSDTDENTESGGCGCRTAGDAPSGLLFVFAGLVLVGLRRRRRVK